MVGNTVAHPTRLVLGAIIGLTKQVNNLVTLRHQEVLPSD